MFSRRVPSSLEPNPLSRAIATRRRAGSPFVDLTGTNPTRAGLPYPAELLTACAAPAALVYDPHPFGAPGARERLAAALAPRAPGLTPDRIVLTASTSEAYSLIFKLLCDPADEVLVPRPSYPLFDHLTALDAVRAVPYRTEYHGLWHIDRESLVDALTDRTRAVLVVSPNNPTGACLRRGDDEWLDELCASRSLALVADEVFADFPLAPADDAIWSIQAAPRRALTFALGGLSKSVALPQLKLAWTTVAGPTSLVRDALARLELIADTYLSVSTPVQVGLDVLLREGAGVGDALRQRLRRNVAALEDGLSHLGATSCLRVEGGWAAVVRVPAVEAEEALVLRLLGDHDVLVHPGYFFDFPREAYLVISLIEAPSTFDAGVARLAAGLAASPGFVAS